jgi:hypothetical protein
LAIGRHVPKLADQPRGCKLRSAAIIGQSAARIFATAYDFLSKMFLFLFIQSEQATGFANLSAKPLVHVASFSRRSNDFRFAEMLDQPIGLM